MKKITMQDIADELQISRVTVWKVFNRQPGVSPALEQKIINKALELGYHKTVPSLLSSEDTGSSGTKDITAVSIVVSRPESSIFWMNIIHQIAKELNKFSINLIYTYLPSRMTEGYRLPSVLSDGTVQGIIVLNVYDLNILTLINQLTIPKVFLDTVTQMSSEQLSGDLVLLEGKNSIYQITESILQKGRRRIGFIGDIGYAQTNFHRYEGFLQALEHHGIAADPSLCLTAPIGIEAYAEVIHTFLDNVREMPQAFVCVSDYVAHFVLKYLLEHNFQVPSDIAVSGFDGQAEYSDSPDFLTTACVDTRALGKRLVRQLLFRIEYPDFPTEVIYQHTKVIYGASTDFEF
ncbi:MAG: LacI family DNA-binding transcriptional regulator [Acetivibrio ethanolgignens]